MIVGYLYNIGNMWDTYAEKNVQWYTMIIIGMIMIGIYDILLGYVIVEKWENDICWKHIGRIIILVVPQFVC